MTSHGSELEKRRTFSSLDKKDAHKYKACVRSAAFDQFRMQQAGGILMDRVSRWRRGNGLHFFRVTFPHPPAVVCDLTTSNYMLLLHFAAFLHIDRTCVSQRINNKDAVAATFIVIYTSSLYKKCFSFLLVMFNFSYHSYLTALSNFPYLTNIWETIEVRDISSRESTIW